MQIILNWILQICYNYLNKRIKAKNLSRRLSVRKMDVKWERLKGNVLPWGQKDVKNMGFGVIKQSQRNKIKGLAAIEAVVIWEKFLVSLQEKIRPYFHHQEIVSQAIIQLKTWPLRMRNLTKFAKKINILNLTTPSSK